MAEELLVDKDGFLNLHKRGINKKKKKKQQMESQIL